MNRFFNYLLLFVLTLAASACNKHEVSNEGKEEQKTVVEYSDNIAPSALWGYGVKGIMLDRQADLAYELVGNKIKKTILRLSAYPDGVYEKVDDIPGIPSWYYLTIVVNSPIGTFDDSFVLSGESDCNLKFSGGGFDEIRNVEDYTGKVSLQGTLNSVMNDSYDAIGDLNIKVLMDEYSLSFEIDAVNFKSVDELSSFWGI